MSKNGHLEQMDKLSRFRTTYSLGAPFDISEPENRTK